jgi:hypothetical protein
VLQSRNWSAKLSARGVVSVAALAGAKPLLIDLDEFLRGRSTAAAGPEVCKTALQLRAASAEIRIPIEFRGKSRYSGGADEFVRQGFIRVRTGWRREEWAYCPLFICGKFGTEIA